MVQLWQGTARLFVFEFHLGYHYGLIKLFYQQSFGLAIRKQTDQNTDNKNSLQFLLSVNSTSTAHTK